MHTQGNEGSAVPCRRAQALPLWANLPRTAGLPTPDLAPRFDSDTSRGKMMKATATLLAAFVVVVHTAEAGTLRFEQWSNGVSIISTCAPLSVSA